MKRILLSIFWFGCIGSLYACENKKFQQSRNFQILQNYMDPHRESSNRVSTQLPCEVSSNNNINKLQQRPIRQIIVLPLVSSEQDLSTLQPTSHSSQETTSTNSTVIFVEKLKKKPINHPILQLNRKGLSRFCSCFSKAHNKAMIYTDISN